MRISTADNGTRDVWPVLACVGAVLFATGWWMLDRTGRCGSDFSAFYAGGRLFWSGSVYDQRAVLELQREIVGCAETGNAFIRLPFFAILMAPLGLLPYPAALLIWKFVLGLMAAGFVWLWPGPRWRTAAFVFCSLPMVTGFAYGQDTVAVLLLVAGAVRLLRSKRPRAAGALIAMGAIKIHLFLWAPLLAVARRRWGVLAGWAAMGAGLAAISFAAAGPHWPMAFLASALNSKSNPHVETMVNFRGMFHGMDNAAIWEMVASLILFAVVARALLRWPFEAAACLALAASVPIGHHSYAYDLVCLLPISLQVMENGGDRWLRASTLFMASPVLPLLPLPWSSERLYQVAVPLFILCVVMLYRPDSGSHSGGCQTACGAPEPVPADALH
jgi:hypothetical protein